MGGGMIAIILTTLAIFTLVLMVVIRDDED